MNKPTILVVEDDVPVRCLITTTLKTHGYKYLTASNGETAIMMTTSHNPDIMLLDLGLPDIDGIEVIRSVRTWSNLPIIVLSARSEDSDKIEALDNGADDYLTKPFHMDELLARIFSLIRRYTRFNRDRNSQEILQYEGLCVNIDERSVKTGNGTFELPPKEFDVLMFLAENQGKILTKQRIYEAVWKEPYVYDDNNIMAVISRLRKKLEENPANPRYIQTIKGIGYRFNREV